MVDVTVDGKKLVDALTKYCKCTDKDKALHSEKNMLSDKWQARAFIEGYCYSEDDVKKALKQFIDWLNNYPDELDGLMPLNEEINQKAKEIFGERLIG